ncbi:MAG: ubiquinol-cytochrome c reductase iron-sulfur subunit [Caldilineaceae bacterium]|jgi:cytochrome b6-f complex iron-sulfur subunit
MADKISDLSGEEREQRIAELKRKMQESAKRNQAAHRGEPTEAPPAPAKPAPVTDDAAAPADETADVATATAEVAVPETKSPPPKRVSSPATRKPAGAAPVAPAAPSTNGSTPKPSAEPEGATKSDMNRREFLTYAWGAALGLLALEGGVLAFQFMYPRFKAGEFGGVFTVGPESALPAPTAAPQPNPAGKFWLVTTEENEPKALYMVCTHLGCLYQWVESNFRFECPCHGSKYTHDGFYIEGPAPRSLDYFETDIVDGIVMVDTGSRTLGIPASESPANAANNA